MATWQQVKNFIYSKYEVSSDEGDTLVLRFATGAGRSQMVLLSHIALTDMASVSFMSPFGRWESVSADRVLRATEQVPAAVKSLGDIFVVYHSQLLATIDEDEIEWPMHLVTAMADQLEQLLGLGDSF